MEDKKNDPLSLTGRRAHCMLNFSRPEQFLPATDGRTVGRLFQCLHRSLHRSLLMITLYIIHCQMEVGVIAVFVALHLLDVLLHVSVYLPSLTIFLERNYI